MMAVTHFIAGAAIANAFGAEPIVQVAAGVWALLPDMDIPSSMVGRKVPVVPLLLKHRGPTHSLVSVAFIYLAVSHFLGQYWAIYTALGWASHILMDMFNPAGIELFWPLQGRIGLGLIRTGGLLEYVIAAGMLFLYFAI